MKGLFKVILGLSCLLCITGGNAYSQGAPPASATGHVFAEIVPMFSAIETSQLSFGKFSPGPQGGDLILTPQNTISALGSVWPGSGTHNAASFYVTGDPGAAYSITLPASPVTIRHMGTARTMTVEEWRSVPEAAPGAGMLENGSQTVFVGATLKVGNLNDNPAGVYTGTYTITFDFN